MLRVPCEVSAGLRASEKTAAVNDIFNRKHHLRVEEDFIEVENGAAYLPIGVVGIDDVKGLALIELPHESDSGISRLWIRLSNLKGMVETVA